MIKFLMSVCWDTGSELARLLKYTNYIIITCQTGCHSLVIVVPPLLP